MDLKTYRTKAMRTCSQPEDMNLSAKDARTFAALMGLSGETGELVDLYKKHYFHGHDIDISKVRKEIGDIMWYVNLLCHTLDFDLEEILDENVAKLEKRYKDGFSTEASKNREEYKKAE